MNKFFKTFVASATVMAIATPAFAATFSDVEGTSYNWANSYVEEMADMGLISGYEDGTFRPGKSVTRLEAISLFARAMGSTNEINSEAVAVATECYADVLEEYDLPYGQGDISYMMYRGALSESELDTYLAADKYNEPMPRYEAATIITKAMGGESEAKANVLFDLDYTDFSSIPSSAKKYVYYVTDKKIMSGMGDGTFSPKSDVLRSQIAVMLYNTVNTMEYSFNEYKLTDIDEDEMILTIEDEDGEAAYVDFSENTMFFVEGEEVEVSAFPAGVDVVLTSNDSGAVYVDTYVSVPDEEIVGIFDGYQSVSGVLSIFVKPSAKSEAVEYECVNKISDITKDGNSATIRDLSKSDYVVVSLKNGKVNAISAINKTTTISKATVQYVDSSISEPTLTISHADEEYDGMEIVLDSDVTVLKNGEYVDMSKVYRGDSVTLTLEYGVITKIVATSNEKTYTGTIKSINISSNPTITVNVKGEEYTYDVTSDIKIVVNGKDGTLYDFRVGDSVTILVEGEAVTRMTASTVQSTSGNYTGYITAVNTSFGFVRIAYTKDETTYEETIYCKDSSTTIITIEGKTKSMKDLEEGNTISVYGTMTNGAFVASSIIIISE